MSVVLVHGRSVAPDGGHLVSIQVSWRAFIEHSLVELHAVIQMLGQPTLVTPRCADVDDRASAQQAIYPHISSPLIRAPVEASVVPTYLVSRSMKQTPFLTYNPEASMNPLSSMKA